MAYVCNQFNGNCTALSNDDVVFIWCECDSEWINYNYWDNFMIPENCEYFMEYQLKEWNKHEKKA